jgi:hypothetical protein
MTQKPHNQSSPVTEKVEGDIWWSETFVQVNNLKYVITFSFTLLLPELQLI